MAREAAARLRATGHTGAVLVKAGITLDWAAQAREAWNVTRSHLAKTAGERGLHHRKNAAYAWRQTVFYLALCPLEQVTAFVDDEPLTHGLSPEVASQTKKILQGLREVVGTGQPADAPFLGWVARSGR